MLGRLIFSAALIGCYGSIYAQGSFTSPEGFHVAIAPTTGYPNYSLVNEHTTGNGRFYVVTGSKMGAPAGTASLYVSINQFASNTVAYAGTCQASVIPGFRWTLNVTPPAGTHYSTIYVPITFNWGQYMAAASSISPYTVGNFWSEASTSNLYARTNSLANANSTFLNPLPAFSVHAPSTANGYSDLLVSATTKWKLTNISNKSRAMTITCTLQQDGTYLGHSGVFSMPDQAALQGYASFSQPASGVQNRYLAKGASLSAAGPLVLHVGSVTHSQGPAPVRLGLAGNYTVFADTGISNAVSPAAITGNMGVGPGVTSTAITGFALTLPAAGAYSTSAQVSGKVYAFDYAAPTPTNISTAAHDMAAAYKDAAGRINPDFLNLKGGNLAGLTLYPGLYTWGSSVTLPVGSDVTLSGGPNDVWIFQISGTLTTGAATHVFLAGGAKAKNIFWQVAGTSVTLGANADFSGIVLAKDAINFGSKTRATGRLLASTAVNLNQNAVTQPAM